MLASFEVMAMAATTQPDKALDFYGKILGLPLQQDTPFALVFTAGGTTVRIQKVASFTPLPFTSFGWTVPDIEAIAKGLLTNGVTCERFAGLQQDELGVWAAPDGAQVAWFKDPDGNILSVTQFG